MIDIIVLGVTIIIIAFFVIILLYNYFKNDHSKQTVHKSHHHNNQPQPPNNQPQPPNNQEQLVRNQQHYHNKNHHHNKQHEHNNQSNIPSDFLTDMGMPSSCMDRTSFQTTAKNFVPSAFQSFLDCLKKTVSSPPGKEPMITMCARTDQILKLRDYLKIFSFAYFPFDHKYEDNGIKYHQYHCKMNSTPKKKLVTTYDPVEVVLYYCSELYTIIGSIADTANSPKHKELHQCLLQIGKNLIKDAQELFSQRIMGKIDWITYFSNPGPYGSTSGNEKARVTWAIDRPHDSKNPNTSIYLESNRRDIGGQFWGNVKPEQDSSTAKAIGRLIKVQTDECIKRYNDVKNTNKKGRWSDVILNTDNIDIFHKFRKSIRTLGRTLETYSFQVSAMYAEIPDELKKNIATRFNVTIKAKYYKEALCLGEYNNKESYPTPANPCVPETILAFLLFGNFYSHTMWGLKQHEYDVLRAMVLMYTLRLGTKKLTDYNTSSVFATDKTTLCPSNMNSYPKMQGTSLTATDAYYNWSKPSINTDNKLFGTFCEIDDIMGDLHDIMVYYQQNGNDTSDSIKKYIRNSSNQVELFFTELNIEKMMNTISKNVC